MTKNKAVEDFLQHCKLQQYPAKHIILREKEPSVNLYYIKKGSVIITTNAGKQREIFITYLRQGDFFGEFGLFRDNALCSTSVRVRKNCEVAYIKHKKLKQLDVLTQDLLFIIAAQLADKLRKTTEKANSLAFHDVHERILHTLLDINKTEGPEITISHQELANTVFSSRETVSRTLRKMEESGDIKLQARKIILLNIPSTT